MALVTVQRSPSSSTSPQSIDSAAGISSGEDSDMGRNSKSLSECYFAGKGTALVLPAASEAQKSSRPSGAGSNIQRHLQSMFYLLRPEETLKMAVKLESAYPLRTRYLVVVSRVGARAEESCLLGIDCNEQTTVGLALRVLADTSITLDGDGGFSVTVCGRHHIFKPVSVQAMWSALQTLHKVSSKAREQNYFQGGLTHAWVSYYEERIKSDRSCLNEWNAMDNLESRRPPSPDSLRTKPTAREETEQVIKSTLKEIMMSVDLDEVTSKYIRTRLEDDFDMDLGEYKSFIDQEMLTILGQMDAPTEIFEHVYLGSEWNASNYEELQRNGVGHILNVTREIDNFFPGTFDYLNIRVCDDEKTDLLRHWDNTFKYITNARRQGSKVLVHCKMGVSRSASVVIAYAMKAYDWSFAQAMEHVKRKRSCVKPNASFVTQLEMYQGILDAMKNREKLQRSKSETNLKSSSLAAKNERLLAGSEPTPIVVEMGTRLHMQTMSGLDLRQLGMRPKSWSPDNGTLADELRAESKCGKTSPPAFRSLKDLNNAGAGAGADADALHVPAVAATASAHCANSPDGDVAEPRDCGAQKKKDSARNVLLPCDNGESYSVSPNQIMHIPNRNVPTAGSVKERVSELESKRAENQKPPSSAVDTWDPGEVGQPTPACGLQRRPSNGTIDDCDLLTLIASDEEATSQDKQPDKVYDKFQERHGPAPEVRLRVKQSRSVRRDGDVFSSQVDRVFDREERKQQRATVIPATEVHDEVTPARNCPSRQSSWSSYDSAVGLGFQGETRETPSRHSSWGSGDTRALPSRNSSWGSYDMRHAIAFAEKGSTHANGAHTDLAESRAVGIFPYAKEDIPWNPGTVRRTKQRLEEHSKLDDKAKAFSDALHGCGMRVSSNVNIFGALHSPEDRALQARLSKSAPEKSNMDLMAENACLSRSASSISNPAQGASVKQHRTFLENLHHDIAKREEPRGELEAGNVGIVQSLKKEFEAKSVIEQRVQQMNITNNECSGCDGDRQEKRCSAPSSPTSLEKPASPTASDPGENVKELRGKFEKNPYKTPPPNRFACVEVSVEKSPIRIKQTPIIVHFSGKHEKERSVESEFKRPPMVPVVRNAPLGQLKAALHISNNNNNNKQQQYGKSHPLAQLGAKQKHNAVYNTM